MLYDNDTTMNEYTNECCIKTFNRKSTEPISRGGRRESELSSTTFQTSVSITNATERRTDGQTDSSTSGGARETPCGRRVHADVFAMQ